jgi:hypothetical protein
MPRRGSPPPCPERITEELVCALETPVDYLPVEADGARTAARMLVELL